MISRLKGFALLPASRHKWMRIGVGFLFHRPMQALEVLFEEKLHAGLQSGRDADMVALHPLGHLMHRDVVSPFGEPSRR